MTAPHTNIAISPDSGALADAAARFVVARAEESLSKTGRFSIALAGGSTPKATYALLSLEPLRSRMPWDKTIVLFGDERAVPADHADSNFRMATEALLSKVDIPAKNVLRMRGEEEPAAAATQYQADLASAIGEDPIDLILLGMGDDGHTASIFPEVLEACRGQQPVVAVYPKSKEQWRITLTLDAINRARNVAFLIAGSGKADMVHRVIEEGGGAPPVPSALIRPDAGALWFFIDQSAAARITA